jgi:hypothetical protein
LKIAVLGSCRSCSREADRERHRRRELFHRSTAPSRPPACRLVPPSR